MITTTTDTTDWLSRQQCTDCPPGSYGMLYISRYVSGSTGYVRGPSKHALAGADVCMGQTKTDVRRHTRHTQPIEYTTAVERLSFYSCGIVLFALVLHLCTYMHLAIYTYMYVHVCWQILMFVYVCLCVCTGSVVNVVRTFMNPCTLVLP